MASNTTAIASENGNSITDISVSDIMIIIGVVLTFFLNVYQTYQQNRKKIHQTFHSDCCGIVIDSDSDATKPI